MCKLCIFIVIFMYSYCYACNILCILFHCVFLYIVCVLMCNVLLSPGVNPIAVNKYISDGLPFFSLKVDSMEVFIFLFKKIKSSLNLCNLIINYFYNIEKNVFQMLLSHILYFKDENSAIDFVIICTATAGYFSFSHFLIHMPDTGCLIQPKHVAFWICYNESCVSMDYVIIVA
jgi:hypothetical protein